VFLSTDTRSIPLINEKILSIDNNFIHLGEKLLPHLL